MGKREWSEFLSIIEGARLSLFSDEAYRGLEYSESHRLPAACDLYENAFSLGLLSKGYGLPGLRIGWIASHNRTILGRIAEIKDYTTICSSAPSELLAEIAIRHGESLLARNRELVKTNLGLWESFFSGHEDRFSWVRPLAGSVAYPTLLGEERVDSFCQGIAEKTGVLLLPGTVFTSGSREFRIGLGRKNTGEALTRLESGLS